MSSPRSYRRCAHVANLDFEHLLRDKFVENHPGVVHDPLVTPRPKKHTELAVSLAEDGSCDLGGFRGVFGSRRLCQYPDFARSRSIAGPGRGQSIGRRDARRATPPSTTEKPQLGSLRLYITYIIVIYFCWKSISRLRFKSPSKSSDSVDSDDDSLKQEAVLRFALNNDGHARSLHQTASDNFFTWPKLFNWLTPYRRR